MDEAVQKYKLDHKIKLRSEDLIFHTQEYDIDLVSNHIYLMGVDRGYDAVGGLNEPGIEFVIASRFIKNLNLCMRANPEKPIVIHMKTCGGDVNEGMAIYDMIKSCPSKVTILNYTHARSMSSIILQAADKRVMMPHSHFMFHEGTYYIEGENKTVYSNLDFDRKNTDMMLGIYADRMIEKGKFEGKPITQVKKYLRDQMNLKGDVFLTAEETLKMGLADEIFNCDWTSLTKYE